MGRKSNVTKCYLLRFDTVCFDQKSETNVLCSRLLAKMVFHVYFVGGANIQDMFGYRDRVREGVVFIQMDFVLPSFSTFITYSDNTVKSFTCEFRARISWCRYSCALKFVRGHLMGIIL